MHRLHEELTFYLDNCGENLSDWDIDFMSWYAYHNLGYESIDDMPEELFNGLLAVGRDEQNLLSS